MQDKDIVRRDFEKTDNLSRVVHSVVGLDHERGFKAAQEGSLDMQQRREAVRKLQDSVRMMGYARWILRLYLWSYLVGLAVSFWVKAPAWLDLLVRLGNVSPKLILVPWAVVWVVTLVFTNAQRARLFNAQGMLPNEDTHARNTMRAGVERWK